MDDLAGGIESRCLMHRVLRKPFHLGFTLQVQANAANFGLVGKSGRGKFHRNGLSQGLRLSFASSGDFSVRAADHRDAGVGKQPFDSCSGRIICPLPFKKTEARKQGVQADGRVLPAWLYVQTPLTMSAPWHRARSRPGAEKSEDHAFSGNAAARYENSITGTRISALWLQTQEKGVESFAPNGFQDRDVFLARKPAP